MQQRESLQGFYNRIDYKKTQERNTEAHINVFERASCTVNTPYSRRDYYKATLILGKGTLEFSDRTYHIDKPALLFSNPLIPYAWLPTAKKQEGWFCIFNEAFVKQGDRLLTELPIFQPGGNHVFFPDKKEVKRISELFEKMMIENQDCYEYKSDVLRSYLHLIVHEGVKMQPIDIFSKPQNASTRITNLFLELLERQFPIDSMQNSLKLTTAADFAKNLSVHTNHLNRAVKQTTGKTTTEHISNRIIIEAQDLLNHSNWNVSEIAYCLGFEYPAHFTNFYKKNTGYSPASLRKAIV